MNILVAGANGFIGKNFVEALKNIRDGKDRTRPAIKVDEIYEVTSSTSDEELNSYCNSANYVFNFAGVNRPKNQEEFLVGNYDFNNKLLEMLKHNSNTCPIMYSSSLQASLVGKYEGSEYGRTKQLAEDALFNYSDETGAKVLVYRFPNVFGKWCKPNYNSAIATFCYNIANDLDITVNGENTELTLLYIDDLVDGLLLALENKQYHCDYDGLIPIMNPQGRFCMIPVTYTRRLGDIVKWINIFKRQQKTLCMPDIPADSFEKKLYSTFLSYLPTEKIRYEFNMNIDARGNFTELVKTNSAGQVSINIGKPGVVRGEHWHNSKWEIFIVVSGHGLIQQRKIGVDNEGNPYPILNFEVSGDKIEAIQILPGYTHNIKNLSDTQDLVTVMWANEPFDPEHPDTFFERVEDN